MDPAREAGVVNVDVSEGTSEADRRIAARQSAGAGPRREAGPTRSARNSSQVRRPIARSGAWLAPARIAAAALPGAGTRTISRRLPAARR